MFRYMFLTEYSSQVSHPILDILISDWLTLHLPRTDTTYPVHLGDVWLMTELSRPVKQDMTRDTDTLTKLRNNLMGGQRRKRVEKYDKKLSIDSVSQFVEKEYMCAFHFHFICLGNLELTIWTCMVGEISNWHRQNLGPLPYCQVLFTSRQVQLHFQICTIHARRKLTRIGIMGGRLLLCLLQENPQGWEIRRVN